jgi:hypothetical protein
VAPQEMLCVWELLRASKRCQFCGRCRAGEGDDETLGGSFCGSLGDAGSLGWYWGLL